MTVYIATDLSRREIDLTTVDAGADHPDLRIDGRLYRALTPEYYAYLRSQMARLKSALDAGQIEQDTYRPLADRFNALHAEAVNLCGEETLRLALRAFTLRAYRAPGDGGEVIEVRTAPKPAWVGQGSLAGFEQPSVVLDAPVAIGQRIRSFDTESTITGYHPPAEDFPGGWVDVVTDAGITGQTDLRFARDLQGMPIVPMTLTPAEQQAASLPDEPFELTDADLDVSELPEPHYYPAGEDPALRCYQPVSLAAVEQVDAIREQAIALGWTDAMLYQNRGRFVYPYGQDYGLVCCLGKDRVIGVITHDTIEIHTLRSPGATLSFSRPPVGRQESQ
ncbi:MAG: hypothetical protein ACYC7E_04670 [Armatimonadota bacterium]